MLDFDLRRSRRKSISMEITDDLHILVRAPQWMRIEDIERFVSEHERWAERHLERLHARREREQPYESSPQAVAELKSRASEQIPPRVAYYAQRMGLHPTGVKITAARKRFGSCSGKNSLCFSYWLMLYPPEAVDYVVVHELAHIVHKNHSPAFYRLIEQYLPDYRERIKMLKR
ncbi:MAG: M48 family metallopeptidase [Clostridia bacterium]